MGLDVYLRKCANLKTVIAGKEAAQEEINALWEGVSYDKLSEAQREELAQQEVAIYHKHGLGDDGEPADLVTIEESSKQHPEHLFKIGYFRSSYNGAGFDSVMERKGLLSLADILQPQGDYYMEVDWAQAKIRVREALDKFEAFIKTGANKYDVMCVRANLFDPDSGPKNEHEALQVALKHLQKAGDEHNGRFRAYSCKDGEFHLDGLKVVAMMPGQDTMFAVAKPCTYLVVEKEARSEDDWYLQALRIVEETIDYVLAQPDPAEFHLAWSS